MGRKQTLFYFRGDGNWWLGDIVNGSVTWTRVGNTGRAYARRIRVLLKILQAPAIGIDEMMRNIQTLFDAASILVEERPREDLTVTLPGTNLPQLDFDTGPCMGGQAMTADQQLLFANRNNAGAYDLVIYFVRATIPASNGCAASPPDRPSAMVTRAQAHGPSPTKSVTCSA